MEGVRVERPATLSHRALKQFNVVGPFWFATPHDHAAEHPEHRKTTERATGASRLEACVSTNYVWH
jgi:hypothetical protein